MTTTRHSTYCPTLGGSGECRTCGASAIDDRTFRGFVHDIRPGDTVNINGVPCQVQHIDHNPHKAHPTTYLVGIDNLGVSHFDIILTNQLVGITR